MVMQMPFKRVVIFAFIVSNINVLHAADSNMGDALQCLIEPKTVVNLSSEVPGVIDEILVERGDRVKKGQVLFRLKSTVEKAAVELAKARRDFSKRKIVRNEDLYEQQLISIHEKDEMETESKIAELELRDARTRLKLRTVASPIDGVVVVRHYSPGEYVETEPVLEIAKNNPLNVEVITPKELIGKIRPGDEAEIYPDEPIGGQYSGKVKIVDEIIDAASGTFGIQISLPNDEFKIPAGINCKVKFKD
jgi:RND family efflux transporter MFP subunit